MGAREDTCCFTGHRPEKLPWGVQEDDPRCIKLKARLHDAVESAYETGMRHFICGMARGCDLYFCEEVLRLREKHGDILLEAAIPCLSQADAWPAPERDRYRRLTALCDVETVVQQQYTSASHVGLIYTLEPIFAAVVAYFLAGEVLKPRGYIGAFMMILSVLIMEIDFGRKVDRSNEQADKQYGQ